MKCLIVLLIIFNLVFPIVAYADNTNPQWIIIKKKDKHTGPLWAVWTHSEDPKECMVKTIFWVSLVTFGGGYVLKKVTEKKAIQFWDNTKRNWTPTVWVEKDKDDKPYPVFGIRVTW